MTELVRILRKNIGEAVHAGNSWVEVSLEALTEAIELIEYQEAVIGHYEMNEARLTAPVEKIRAEAIKNFAKRLRSLAYTSKDWSHGEHPYVVEVEDIERLVEEMTDEADS